MLAEVRETRQVEGEGYRRWFRDSYFDLIVWYENEGGAIEGFQLCYDKEWNERALTWRRAGGFDHSRVDDGEKAMSVKRTPVLVPDGEFNSENVAWKFQAESTGIDPEIARFVHERIAGYPD